MILSTKMKMRILKAPYGVGVKEKYSHRQRFRVLRDIERGLRTGELQLDDSDFGHVLDERDRFQMHYLESLPKRDYFQILKMFDFIDDERYLSLVNSFFKQLSPGRNDVRCPSCKSIVMPNAKGHFPCPRCHFKPKKGKKSYLHCEFKFSRKI
jgi:hypothetical protein